MCKGLKFGKRSAVFIAVMAEGELFGLFELIEQLLLGTDYCQRLADCFLALSGHWSQSHREGVKSVFVPAITVHVKSNI